MNGNIWISIKISLKFGSKGPINNIPILIQIMAWCRLGDKPLSEPMVVSLLTYICVTRPELNHVVPGQTVWWEIRYRKSSRQTHYNDVIMSEMASQITSLTIVLLNCLSWRKENTKDPRHWPLWGEFTGDRCIPLATREMLPFDDVIMMHHNKWSYVSHSINSQMNVKRKWLFSLRRFI